MKVWISAWIHGFGMAVTDVTLFLCMFFRVGYVLDSVFWILDVVSGEKVRRCVLTQIQNVKRSGQYSWILM